MAIPLPHGVGQNKRKRRNWQGRATERVQCDKGSEEDTLKREEVSHSPAYFRENGGGNE